jgi:glycosyltransferase involved in cell wall biosynthesis
VNDKGAIVHVCEALGGGVLRVVQALADATAELGMETAVVHGRRPETPASLEGVFHARVRVVEVPGWGDRSLRGAGAMLRACSAVNRELRRHPGGVLHLHSTFAGIVGRLLPAHGHEIFYTPHAYVFLNPSVSPRMRSAARLTERALSRRGRTIACSPSEATVASALTSPSNVVVITNGIDVTTLPSPQPEPRDEFVVGCVGRAVYQRRPDTFAKIAATIGPGFDGRFVWFGDGPFRDALTRAGVEVTGWLSEAEAARAYGYTNVILHLSAFEGLPIALLEAMAAARPIVATDLPAIRDVVGDSARLVSTEEAAIGAIRSLRGDPALRERLGSRGRDRVQKCFTRKAMVEQTLAVYSRSIGI